jgi:hypothetical protein
VVTPLSRLSSVGGSGLTGFDSRQCLGQEGYYFHRLIYMVFHTSPSFLSLSTFTPSSYDFPGLISSTLCLSDTWCELRCNKKDLPLSLTVFLYPRDTLVWGILRWEVFDVNTDHSFLGFHITPQYFMTLSPHSVSMLTSSLIRVTSLNHPDEYRSSHTDQRSRPSPRVRQRYW